MAPWLLGHLIESRAICAAAESYLGYRTFGFFFSFAAAMFRAFYVGTTNTRILTANSVVMVLTNVVLNYLLIFGGWGIPPLGIAGAAIASVISEEEMRADYILPDAFNPQVAKAVAKAVADEAVRSGVARI